MTANSLTDIANRLGSDKGTTTFCGHGYTRIYEAILGPVREYPLRIAEIGLLHPRTRHVQGVTTGCPSLTMWAEYLPHAEVHGLDIIDFRAFATDRIHIACGDQGKRDDLADFARTYGPFDLIIDDGSHASHHQQISLATLFSHLVPGGIYIVEDLHFQPAELEIKGISLTRAFLRELRYRHTGSRTPLTQFEFQRLTNEIRDIHFFDSLSTQWPLVQLEDALAVIVRQGVHPMFGSLFPPAARKPVAQEKVDNSGDLLD